MRTKVTDERLISQHKELLNTECEVFTYCLEEKETNLVYLALEGYWMFESSYSNHITKVLKLKNGVEITEICVTPAGTITSIKAKLDPKSVSFKNLMTEEQKQKRATILKSNLSKK